MGDDNVQRQVNGKISPCLVAKCDDQKPLIER